MSASPEAIPDPIAFIREEHERQLEVCHGLEELVSMPEHEPVAERAVLLLRSVTADLKRHVQDEEQDLFPLLLKRHKGNGDLEEILDQLLIEHEGDREFAQALASDLREVAAGAPLPTVERLPARVRAFCELQRRHLNWENRVVLPLADRLLGDADRKKLGRRMLARRREARGVEAG